MTVLAGITVALGMWRDNWMGVCYKMPQSQFGEGFKCVVGVVFPSGKNGSD